MGLRVFMRRTQKDRSKKRPQDVYAENPGPLKELAKLRSQGVYAENPEPQKERSRLRSQDVYAENPEPLKESAKLRSQGVYAENSAPQKARAKQRSRDAYSENPEPLKESAKQRSQASYAKNPAPQKARAKQRSRESYAENPELQNTRCKDLYSKHQEAMQRDACVQSSVYRPTETQSQMPAFRAVDFKDSLLHIAACHQTLETTKWSTCVQCWRGWYSAAVKLGALMLFLLNHTLLPA